ncbi:hypothetical protein Bca4012_062891 [Brassica carinata]
MDVDMLFIEEKAKLFQDSVKVPSPAVSVTLWLRTLEALTTISKTNLLPNFCLLRSKPVI